MTQKTMIAAGNGATLTELVASANAAAASPSRVAQAVTGFAVGMALVGGMTPSQRAKIEAQLDAQEIACARGIHPEEGRTHRGGVERCGQCERAVRG